MRVRLWIREDKRPDGSVETPKAIALDAERGPGPGRVVDVEAPSVGEARRLLAVSLYTEPDELGDPDGWVAWRAACRAVKACGGGA